MHEGMFVRIREWDDMAAEFGVNDRGNIMAEAIFSSRMRSLCGTVGVIKNLNDLSDGNYRVVFEDHDIIIGDYFISPDMLESVDINEVCISEEDLSAILQI